MLRASPPVLPRPPDTRAVSLRRIVVLLFSLLFVASAQAQLTINRYVNASNAVVGIGQDKFSTLNWANNGFTNITGVSARVVLSSVSPPDDVFFLGDTAAFLSYNIGETNGVTNAVVFPFDGTNDATSLDATFVVTNSFTSPGLTNEWDLTVSSSLTNSGDVVFNYWRLILTGGAVTNGTIEPGAQGIISGSDGYAVTATVSAGSGTGSNAVTAFVTNSQSLNFNGGISGSGELAKTGAGTLSVGSSTNFSGSFRLAEGTANFTATNSLGTGTLVQSNGSSTAIFSAGGTYTQNMSLYNVSFTNGGNVLSGTITNNNTTYTVSAGTTNTLSGVLTGTGGVTKEGDGELVIAGSANNTYTGATVVNDGSLVLSNSSGNAIDSSSSITVNSGGTLVLGASNQIGDGIGLILNGGTFITGDSSNRYSETLGTLTLTADSTLDLGGLLSGSATLQFADSSAISWTPGAILTITNWQGTAFTPSTISTILFSTNTGLTTTQLGQIRFASQGGLIGGLVGSELVPVPEPQVYAGALALVAFVIWRERKRLASLLRRR
jgi:autotransporter-associated beta strand protein